MWNKKTYIRALYSSSKMETYNIYMVHTYFHVNRDLYHNFVLNIIKDRPTQEPYRSCVDLACVPMRVCECECVCL